MDTPLLTTKTDSETAATKPGKTDRGGQPTAGKVDSGEEKPSMSTTPKAPTAKRDRKAAPVTKDAPVTVADTEPTGEDPTVTEGVPVTAAGGEVDSRSAGSAIILNPGAHIWGRRRAVALFSLYVQPILNGSIQPQGESRGIPTASAILSCYRKAKPRPMRR